MSNFEFAIPLQKDELLESHAGQYHVEDIVQPRVLLSKLQDAARAFNAEGVEYILEHFDTYFSIIVHGNKLEWNVINKGFEHIVRASKSLCNHLELILQDKEIDSDLRIKNLNILKMMMYLYTQIMKTKDTKLATDNSTKLTLGKKGKKVTTDEDEFCGWTESDKLAALVTLNLVLQQPLFRLWDPPLAEDNFVSMVADPCYKALEEQIIKNKSIRETVFQVLGVLIKKYNHGTSCLIKLVQVLQMMEHAVSPICAGVVQLTKEFGLGTFGPQMVREIAEALASTDDENVGAGTEQGATKNCGAFLLELTKEMPKEMTTAIATIQPYLESDESYTLRISVLGMMCEALSSELRGEGLPDDMRAQRDDFLDDLYEHMHDLSAYVRHKVLQFWCRLQRENCVPVSRQKTVLERCIGRLKDKAALVRKAAVQLLKIFLECNPFSAQLKLEILEEQLKTEQDILDDLQKKLNNGPAPELVKQWEGLEREVVSAIKKGMEVLTQDEPELSQASLDNLYEAIRKHLREKNYYKAYLIVKHTERQYPDAKLMRCDMEKSDQIAYFVALLRNIFIIPDRTMSLTQQCEQELALYKRIEEKENIVAFLQESVHFSRMVSEAVPVINSLLMSKQAGDVSEAIDFFVTAHHFNIESAKMGVANMLLLVWSPDQDKREAVERAYRDMYLECDNKAERARCFAIANKLVSLMSHIDRGSALALEHLVAKWVDKGDISPGIIQVFWEMFLKKIDGTTDMDSYAALTLLVLVAKAKPSVAVANLDVIQTHGLTAEYNSRNLSVQLLLSLAKKNQRYPEDHALFKSIYDSLLDAFSKLDKFTAFAANCIDLIYGICDTPEILSAKILAEMYKRVEETIVRDGENEEEITVPVELLTRFVFLLGQVALQQLIYLDINVYSELRRRNQVREERKAEEKRKKKAGAFATPGKRGRVDDLRRQTLMNVSNASASSRQQRSASVTSTKGPSVNTTMTEEEALEGAVADDADAEYVRSVCERDIVGAGSALAAYVPLLRALLTTPAAPALQAAAALAYTRFMLVSSAVCDEGLQLMMTVLKKSKNVSMRTNLTIAFADLTLRFPNLTQPWTHHIYHILTDEELEVRQCAVKMLSFLVLHEMVRVKGQIADMALCCADKDPRVASMTKIFFKQLSQKGNALYNVMPDIISRLSDPELNVPEEHYRSIMKYITSLIQKDRQMEALIEKLCQRFKLSTEERQWRDLAYCLSLFTYNERSLRKLIENLDCYKDKLHCTGVMDSFNTLMNNTSKMARNEIKALVTELGEKIEECFAVRGEENGNTEENSEGAANSGSPPTRKTEAVKATPRRKPAARRNRRKSSSSPDENEPPSNEKTPQSVRKSSRKAATRANKAVANDSDDSDDDFQKKDDEEVFKKPAVKKTTRRRKL
ncbi:condensin complex subunit 1 [Spodoptera litura]|uniref:Condensin complex subunit 1 n=1 Tax=Spodoptera litura TaxID=69820 RepID=A0A9J7DQK2_SPOLT|nr:condensin complex subunit 1 [Spodoptera litura]